MSPLEVGFYLSLLAIVTSNKVWSLQISSVEVPPAVMNSSQVMLVCNYDLQGDQLYSVKWYKNYVEFYRYQPSYEPTTTTSSSSAPLGQQSQQPADNQPAAHSKHEFELDGINLNLSKSNATHVYLQQVSLASEGTYKCELSAESPSFATVSMERQMKVYILPKQKLSILDNSVSTTAASSPPPPPSQRPSPLEQQTMKSALTYNINDFVNLTCVSSASRPPAKLTWLLNDLPVAASSKWLQHSSRAILQGSEQLTETRLTLAFRLQPSHLLKNTGSGTDAPQAQARHQSLKARCLSKLSVQFTSESSIVVSGGKTTIKRRKETTTANVGSSDLPAPSSLSTLRDQTASQLSAGGESSSNPIAEYPIYRWPRPLLAGAALSGGARHHSGRKNFSYGSSFSEAWITSSGRTMGGDGGVTELDGDLDNVQRTGGRQNGRHLVVWTNRQLKEQAEHIDSVMRLAHPNELDTPVIEGKIQVDEPNDPGATMGPSFTENWSDPEETSSMADLTTAKPSVTMFNTNQDYELDDLVQFTCTPRVGFKEDNSIKSVASKWFINDKEISAHLVNAFDGNKFYYSRDLYDAPAKSFTNHPRTPSQYLNPSNEEPEGTNMQSTNTEQQESSTFATQLPLISSQTQQQTHQNSSSLLVEFSSSLFQLKELNLKCRTVVEQPLIQYESQVVITVPANPFIQADHHHKHKAGGSYYRNPNSRQNGRVYNTNGNQKGRNSVRSSSSVSKLSLKWPHYSLFILVSLLLTRHLLHPAR